jgi:hypothetical protein
VQVSLIKYNDGSVRDTETMCIHCRRGCHCQSGLLGSGVMDRPGCAGGTCSCPEKSRPVVLAPKRVVTVSKRGPSKPRRSAPTDKVALRIILSAPGVDANAVADYVRQAVGDHMGQFEADDWRRNIKIVRVLKRAWVDVETDATQEEDSEL